MKNLCLVSELPQNTQDRIELYLISNGVIGEDLQRFFNERLVNVMGNDIVIDSIIKGEKYLYDTEEDAYYSIRQIEDEYIDLVENGNTEAENFNQYLANCLDRNGTLEWGRF